jgi:hypothetical protein
VRRFTYRSYSQVLEPVAVTRYAYGTMLFDALTRVEALNNPVTD